MSLVPPPLPPGQTALCDLCRERPIATDITKLPVCEVCRERLVRRPFPMWIKLVAVGVVILMIVAFVEGQAGLEAALEFERGHRNELAGHYAAALSHYELANKALPGSTRITLALARSAMNLNHPDRAAELLLSLRGVQVEGELAREAIALQSQLQQSGHLQRRPTH